MGALQNCGQWFNACAPHETAFEGKGQCQRRGQSTHMKQHARAKVNVTDGEGGEIWASKYEQAAAGPEESPRIESKACSGLHGGRWAASSRSDQHGLSYPTSNRISRVRWMSRKTAPFLENDIKGRNLFKQNCRNCPLRTRGPTGEIS